MSGSESTINITTAATTAAITSLLTIPMHLLPGP